MRLLRFTLAVLAAVVTVAAAHADETDFAGRWTGELDAGAAVLTLDLELSRDETGWTGVLISVDQGGARIPLQTVQIDGDAVSLAAPALQMRYEGRLQDGAISGEFRQGGLVAPLVFVRTGIEAAAAPAGSPRDQNMTVRSGEVALAGSLRLPDGEGPFPAVVILSGSGPQDRDGTIAGQQVYKALADAFEATGIASLRLDDRGVGGSDAVAPAAPADLAADAAAALDALRGVEAISCAGFAGHSEGATIALLAAEASDPAFIVSLAGMYGGMEEVLLEQAAAIMTAAGMTEAQIAANQALQHAIFEAIETSAPGETRAAIRAAMIEAGAPEALAEREAATWGQPYAVAMFDIDPAAAAAAYDGPLLAIFAEKDTQVLAAENAARLQAAGRTGDTEIVTLDGVDHLFQASETGSPAAYGSAGHALEPAAAEAIASRTAALAARACAQ
ncbi:MAG: alpha/beta hydrolase [Oceanicaulis sp.]